MPRPSLIRPHPGTLLAAWLPLGIFASSALLQLQPPLAWHEQQRLWLALPFWLASLYLLWSVAQQLPSLRRPGHSGWRPIGVGLSPFPSFWSRGMIEPSP